MQQVTKSNVQGALLDEAYLEAFIAHEEQVFGVQWFSRFATIEQAVAEYYQKLAFLKEFERKRLQESPNLDEKPSKMLGEMAISFAKTGDTLLLDESLKERNPPFAEVFRRLYMHEPKESIPIKQVMGVLNMTHVRVYKLRDQGRLVQAGRGAYTLASVQKEWESRYGR